MKLLLDMNLSPRWVDLLCAAGFEAAHWAALGEPGALLTVDPSRARLRLLPLRLM